MNKNQRDYAVACSVATRMRRDYREGKLSPMEIAEMQEMEFVFEPGIDQLDWNEKFNQCVDFQEKENRKPSPYSQDKDERVIGQWLKKQEEITKRCGKCHKVVDRSVVICPYCGRHTVVKWIAAD